MNNMQKPTQPIGSKDNPYDIVISGAGPAGLTAGIFAGRYKLKALICEKEEHPWSFPRGETLHNAKIFSQVLGDNVLNLISIHITAARKFNSPMVKNTVEVFRRTPSIVFEWNNFIELLKSRLLETATKIRTNSEVEELIYEDNKCCGIRLQNGEEIYAKSIIVADGHNSLIGKNFHIPYEKINFPIVKRIIRNFHGDYYGFEYFFLVPGMLNYAPRFPPAVIFVFPRNKEKCEVGMMIFADVAKKLKNSCDLPDEAEIMRVWNQLIATYPRFSDLMRNTEIEFEGFTYIGAGEIYNNPMPVPGVFLTGEAMGFIEKSGASGIASSMQIAKFAVDYIASKKSIYWSKSSAKSYSRTLKRTDFYHHIRKNAQKTQIQKYFFFQYLRTEEKINKKWNLVKALYKV